MIINLTEKLLLDLSTEWSQLFGKYNWYSFTFIEIYFENDEFTGGYEFVMTLVGFKLRIRYNTKQFYEKVREWEIEDTV